MLPLEESISPALKAAGFTKKSRTWWRENEEAIQVLNLQKSAAGTGLLFNLGIYVRALGTERKPPVGRCHIQARLEGVIDQEASALVLSAWSGQAPTDALASVVLRDGVTWLGSLSTLAGIRRHVLSSASERMLVVDAVRALFADSA